MKIVFFLCMEFSVFFFIFFPFQFNVCLFPLSFCTHDATSEAKKKENNNYVKCEHQTLCFSFHSSSHTHIRHLNLQTKKVNHCACGEVEIQQKVEKKIKIQHTPSSTTSKLSGQNWICAHDTNENSDPIVFYVYYEIYIYIYCMTKRIHSKTPSSHKHKQYLLA